MSSKKVYFIMLGAILLLVALGAASLVMGSKLLNKQSEKLVELKLEDRLLEEQQIALVEANRNIEKYSELEKIAKSIVPQEKDQARAVREITQFAAESGITLKSISFPTSNLGQKVPPVSPGAEGGPPAAPPVTQVKPVEGIPGVYSLEITIQSADERGATYGGFLDFLERLERNRRTAHVTNISITPSTTVPNALSFSLIVNVYIKP